MWPFILLLIIWKIWDARNAKTFRNVDVSPFDVIKGIIADLTLWSFYSVYPLGSTVYVWVDRFVSFSIILEFSFFYYLSMNILMGMEFHNTEREQVAIRNANCVLIRLTIRIFSKKWPLLFILYRVNKY